MHTRSSASTPSGHKPHSSKAAALGQIVGSSNPRLAVVILIQAIIFGLFHSYQGLAGIFGTGAIAIAMGFFFYFSKRIIWTCVLAHGIIDTIGFTEAYLK